MDLRETYNRIAAQWHEDHRADEWWLEGAKAFAKMLPEGGTILDLGCGSGNKAKFFAEGGLQVTGVDFAERMIDIAKREAPEAKFIVMDARELEKLEGKFDGVFMEAFLLHFPKRESQDIVRLAASKLLPGGSLYISVKERREGQEEEGVRREDDYGYPYERFFSYYDASEIRGYLKNASLQVSYENVFPWGKTRWLSLIGTK